jgi:hypothetical protein
MGSWGVNGVGGVNGVASKDYTFVDDAPGGA